MRKLLCYKNTLVGRREAPPATSNYLVDRELRANLRRINHIASMTLVLEGLATHAGLTMTSCLLSQAAEEARTTSIELQDAEKPLEPCALMIFP
jgi:hypothetical protein